MPTIPITPQETRLSLKALAYHLRRAFPYSYGYQGTPPYLNHQISSVSFRLARLIQAVYTIESRCPAKFYKPRAGQRESRSR